MAGSICCRLANLLSGLVIFLWVINPVRPLALPLFLLGLAVLIVRTASTVRPIRSASSSSGILPSNHETNFISKNQFDLRQLVIRHLAQQPQLLRRPGPVAGTLWRAQAQFPCGPSPPFEFFRPGNEGQVEACRSFVVALDAEGLTPHPNGGFVDTEPVLQGGGRFQADGPRQLRIE